LGTFIFSGSPSVAEVAGLAGFDFVIIDREHSPSSWDTTVALVRAVAAADCPALVRVTGMDSVEIGHAVDSGAAGVMVPRVSAPHDVQAIVAAARYAPLGQKGACPVSRNAGLGLRRHDYASVTEESNQRFLLVGIIEDRLGIENLDAILAEKPGLDLVLLGRSDLAADLSHVGDIRHREVEAAVARYVAVTAPTAKGGMVVTAGEDAGAWIDAGMRMLVLGIDLEILARAYSEAASAHRTTLERRAAPLG
jgi:2-keto-3-deoxy-L-rhamnonate aldolase RhmA